MWLILLSHFFSFWSHTGNFSQIVVLFGQNVLYIPCAFESITLAAFPSFILFKILCHARLKLKVYFLSSSDEIKQSFPRVLNFVLNYLLNLKDNLFGLQWKLTFLEMLLSLLTVDPEKCNSVVRRWVFAIQISPSLVRVGVLFSWDDAS